MKFGRHDADCYVPDGKTLEEAMARSSIMAIGSHPDDIEIMAMPGILAGVRAGGNRFFGVVATNGGGLKRTGDYSGFTYLETREVRRAEQKSAAECGKYSAVVLLGYDSAEWKNPHDERPHADLVQLIDGARPEILYMHNPFDRHDTHVAACMRTIGALREVAGSTGWVPEAVYGCEVWRSLDWTIHGDRCALPVDDPEQLSACLIRQYKSQYAQGRFYDTALRGRRMANATHQEAQSSGEHPEIEFAVDLLPLIKDPKLSVEAYARHVLNHFVSDTMARVEHYAPFGSGKQAT